MRTVGRAYFLHLRINANEFSHECYNNGVDTIFHSHRNHNMLTMSLCYQKYLLRLACLSEAYLTKVENELLLYINKKSLANIVTHSAGPHLKLFVSINSFMPIIGIHHLEFKENLFPLLISFKCKARNCYDNQNAPKFKRCLRHTQLILQQES